MGGFSNFVDSFKLAPAPVPIKVVDLPPEDASALKAGGHDGSGSEDEKAVDQTVDPEKGTVGVIATTADGTRLTSDESGLKRGLSNRHMQMIAFGGAIGTGLFVGSGGTYATGGPGFLLLDYILIGVMLFCVVMALGELAATFPVSGSFSSYSTRFIAPSWGFAMGWNYWMQWFIILPLELVAASIVIRYWDADNKISPGVWLIIFIIVIGVINLFGVRGYGEFEVFASMVKISAVVGFIILGIVITSGGGPSRTPIGDQYWHTAAGAFFNGFQGFCSVFVTAAFAFAGTELIGLAAAETANPRKEVPKAAKQIFARILVFYVFSLLMVTLTVDPTNDRLGGGSYDARASPFVIAIENAGINVLPDIFNAVILVSVLSVGNSGVYAASRTLLGLAQAGQAPRIFTYIDREGRPLPAVALSMIMGFLSFLIYAGDKTQGDVFNWLLALSGLSTIFTWGSICACHVRFRMAWKRNGHTLEELSWKSPLGVWASVYGASFCVLVIIFQIIIGAWPIESPDSPLSSNERATAFFQACLTIPVVAVFFFFGELDWDTVFLSSWEPVRAGGLTVFYKPTRFWRRSWVRIEDIDVTTGRRDPVPVEVLRREREDWKAMPLWKRAVDTVF